MAKKFWSASELETGIYTPVATGNTNVASAIEEVCSYVRVGDTVTVSGRVSITAVSSGAYTRMYLSLPIPSIATGQSAGGGTASFYNAGANVAIYFQTLEKQMDFQFTAPSLAASWYAFSFTYRTA